MQGSGIYITCTGTYCYGIFLVNIKFPTRHQTETKTESPKAPDSPLQHTSTDIKDTQSEKGDESIQSTEVENESNVYNTLGLPRLSDITTPGPPLKLATQMPQPVSTQSGSSSERYSSGVFYAKFF